MSLHIDGEVSGLGVPHRLVFGIDHVGDELPGGIHLFLVAGVDHPQGAAAGGNAALILGVYIGEVGGADFEGIAHVGQNAGQVGGGSEEDGGFAGDEGRAALRRAAALDVGGEGALGDLLPHVEQIQRRAVFIENDLGCIALAAVAVVNIVTAHFADPLFKEPAVVGEQEAIAVNRAVRVVGCQLLGDIQDAVNGGRDLGDAGRVKGGLVVVHQRRGAVEGHGVDHAVDGVVSQKVRLDDGGVKAGFVDVGLQRHHLLGVDDEAGADFVALYDIKRQRFADACRLQLVDGVIVFALVLRVYYDFVL